MLPETLRYVIAKISLEICYMLQIQLQLWLFFGYYISGINPGAKLLLGWDVIALINGRGGDERHLMLQEQQSESKLSVKKKNFNALESNQNQWY